MPFMMGDRVCVLREREERDIAAAIASAIPNIKLSRDFDKNKILVISGKELSSVPPRIRKGFLFPSLGKWAVPQLRNVE